MASRRVRVTHPGCWGSWVRTSHCSPARRRKYSPPSSSARRAPAIWSRWRRVGSNRSVSWVGVRPSAPARVRPSRAISNWRDRGWTKLRTSSRAMRVASLIRVAARSRFRAPIRPQATRASRPTVNRTSNTRSRNRRERMGREAVLKKEATDISEVYTLPSRPGSSQAGR